MASSKTTMHECFAGLPFSPRAAALISLRTTFPCHPHDTPVDLLASSRTAGSGSRELEFSTDAFSVVANGSSGTAATAQKLISPGRWSLPTTTISSHSKPTPVEHFGTAGDGSSRPPHLFKKTSVHDLGLPPSTGAFPGPRFKPIQMSSPPPGTAPPGRFTCSKRPLYNTPGSLLQERPSLA
jgi:hypothetical protein